VKDNLCAFDLGFAHAKKRSQSRTASRVQNVSG
jgi:hypothetical protein